MWMKWRFSHLILGPWVKLSSAFDMSLKRGRHGARKGSKTIEPSESDHHNNDTKLKQ